MTVPIHFPYAAADFTDLGTGPLGITRFHPSYVTIYVCDHLVTLVSTILCYWFQMGHRNLDKVPVHSLQDSGALWAQHCNDVSDSLFACPPAVCFSFHQYWTSTWHLHRIAYCITKFSFQSANRLHTVWHSSGVNRIAFFTCGLHVSTQNLICRFIPRPFKIMRTFAGRFIFTMLNNLYSISL